MLEEANKRESTLTSQLKEKEKPNKWNKWDKELGKKITTLKKPKGVRMSEEVR